MTEETRWCCNGNAEDCTLCTDPNPNYPWICPGHPDSAENRARVQPTPASADTLRQRIAEAIYLSHWPNGRWELRPEEEHDLYRKHADAVLAVVQPELDRLGEEHVAAVASLADMARNRNEWQWRAEEGQRTTQIQRLRAEQAETRLDRIRDATRLHRQQLISINELYAVIEAMDFSPAATEATAPAHDAGPSVREAAAADRTWPLQKHGE